MFSFPFFFFSLEEKCKEEEKFSNDYKITKLIIYILTKIADILTKI